MSEFQSVSPGIRGTIRDFLRNIYVNWVKNGKFYTALRDKTKNGAKRLHPKHIQEVLYDIYHKAKSGIISFVKKVLTAPINFVRALVSFMISELVTSKDLQQREYFFPPKRITIYYLIIKY